MFKSTLAGQGIVPVALLVIGLCTTGAVAQSAYIISGTVDQTPAYMGPPTEEWMIPGAPLDNGKLSGPGLSLGWSIAPTWDPDRGTFMWTGNELTNDNSGLPNNPDGIAHGFFGPGGEIRIYGELYNSIYQSLATLVYDGPDPLFVGSVGSFEMQETNENQNRLNLIGSAAVIPTGGWLYDNGYLEPYYALTLDAVKCSAEGTDIEDFQSSIDIVEVMQFALTVPEPSAALLLLGGLSLLITRRKNR